MNALRPVARARSSRFAMLAIPAAASLALAVGTPASANVSLIRVSHDIYTDAQAQHQTEVEPDTVAAGSTIVSVFQVGRVFRGGASNIGWATSTNGGATWSHGYLPGITGNAGGPFGRASDPSVAYDARHKTWLITSLADSSTSVDVLASRSTDGGLIWSKPVTVATGNTDKDWITCDDTPTSPHYGNCYVEYDLPNLGDPIMMQTSTDGGATWGPAVGAAGTAIGLGGQPVVLPNGDVVVPYLSAAMIRSFRSTNGGASWSSSVLVSNISVHTDAGGLRAGPLPSAAVDAAGTVYIAWADCRFRVNCASNDIVIAKSTSETTWATPVRVPIDPVSSTADHFTPGLAVDPSTSGATARIGLTYYYYPKASCSAATCQLNAGFISSANGGATWSAPTQLAGPMSLSWLPDTLIGRMFGDYIATAIPARGNAYPVIPVATAPTGTTFHQAMYAPAGGLPVTGGARPALVARATSAAAPPHAPALATTAR
jgi:hypothetical protein